MRTKTSPRSSVEEDEPEKRKIDDGDEPLREEEEKDSKLKKLSTLILTF